MDSTRAYQGYAGGCEQGFIDALEKAVVGTTRPALTLVFDLDPMIGLARARSRGDAVAEDRYERKGLAFHMKLRDGFLDILRQLSHGVGYTLLVTLACSATGLLSGLLIAGSRQLGGAGTALLLDVYTYIFRGIPVLVLLFVVYFGFPGLGLKVALIIG
jgi:His/Glu/Gln/Arg/opine family amino acid ABC transporter permease subunit